MFAIALAGALLTGVPGTVPPTLPVGHTLSGQVTDSSGTGIAGVRIVVLELARITQTSPEGKYSVPDLPDGSYGISFSAIGFAPVVRRVTLQGQDLVLDLALKPSLIELPALQTTATPIGTTLLTSPQPADVIGGIELRTAQAPSLGETLNVLPGVHSWSTGVGIGKPVIRGLSANRVLVLDNGQRLETAQWGDEHSPNLETETAERIEVIRGPASVLYGSDALGGVVNVIPRDLPSDGFHGMASAAYGANNRQPDGALLVEGGSKRFGLRATMSGRKSDDVRTPGYVLWNSANQAIGGSGTAGFRGSWGTLTGTFSQRNEKIHLTDEDPEATPLQRINTSRARLDLTLPVGLTRIDANVGFEQNRRREFEEADDPTVALGLRTRTWTGNLHLHHPAIGRLNGLIGLSGFQSRFSKFGEETLIPDNKAYNIGAFAFEQIDAGRWNFSLGARVDHRHMDVSDDDELGVTAQTRNWNSVTGNVGALFRISDPVAVVLNLGRGYRAPSAFDLFSNGVHEGTVSFERGDPALKNETSINTDLALRVQSSRVRFEIGGFANLIQNFIFTVPTGETDPESGFEIFQTTQGNARLLGFEASLEYHPVAAIHLQGSADYTHGQNTATANPLPQIPPFRAQYQVRLEGKSRGSWIDPYLMVGGETNARQSRQDPAEALFYATAFDGEGYVSRGYTLARAGAGIGIVTGNAVLRIDLLLHNAFNTAYADYLSRIKTNAENPGMGRNFIVKVSTDF